MSPGVMADALGIPCEAVVSVCLLFMCILMEHEQPLGMHSTLVAQSSHSMQ